MNIFTAVVRFIMWVYKTMTGSSITEAPAKVAAAIPKPLNQTAHDKGVALATENAILRNDAKLTDAPRVEEIQHSIEVTNEKGEPSGLDFSSTRRK